MIQILIGDKKHDIPTDWKDMTLEFWCKMYNVISKYVRRDENGEIIEDISESELEGARLNKDLFMALTGLSEKEMVDLDANSVNQSVIYFHSTLQQYKPKGITEFTFEDEVYYFPKEFLKSNTFGDYIEATHLEETVKVMKHGRFDILPEQMAILCRRAGEEYDDDAIPEKTERFKQLKMDLVWEFAFFLTQQSVKLSKTFPIYSVENLDLQKEVEYLQKEFTINT